MSATASIKPVRVLGIDPGSRFLGYGIVTKRGNQLTPEIYGTLRVNLKLETHQRLQSIYEGVSELLTAYRPDHVAIEKVFFAKDATAALKLGQARGVTLLSVAQSGATLFEYSPNEVKRAVVGYGHADKDQIAKMVTLILKIKEFETSDTSDALAIAICHLNSYVYRERMTQTNTGVGF